MSSINPSNISKDIQTLQNLASQTDKSSAKVQKNLVSTGGRFTTWIQDKRGEMPKWAAKHIEMYKHLEDAVGKIKAKGEGDKIPEDVVKTLKESKKVVDKLANKVNYSAFLKAILPETATIDQHSLLIGDKGGKLKQSQTEWHLNLGLLMNVYNRTTNPDMKKQIEFLALNYLAKAAPGLFNTSLEM